MLTAMIGNWMLSSESVGVTQLSAYATGMLFLLVHSFERQVWEGSDYESLYPWTNVNHVFLVDTYKWLLVTFQCKFLSIQEVVKLFHSPDSS